MNDVKVSLNVILPGRTMFSKQECLKQLKEPVNKRNKKSKVKTVSDPTKTDKFTMTVGTGRNKEVIEVHIRRCKPVVQSINLTHDAYEFMTSLDARIGNSRLWKSMSKTKRLEANLIRYAESLGGVLKDYVIFED